MARAVLAVAVVLVVAVAGCGGTSGSGAGDSAGRGSGGGLSTLVEVAAADRRPAPGVAGELLDGSGRFDLASARGQVVVVNFWASWCAPCRVEATELEAVHRATKAKGVTFLGINVQDGRDAALAFERGRTSYPSIFDPAGRVALDFKDLPPNTLPATVVIDREGRLAVVVRTAVRVADLQPIVERIAAEPPDG
jgi:thiol-disulfide isomerase/thioredoxin